MADPDLFRCNPRDDAAHPDPSPGFFEWWYIDGLFDDLSSFSTSWHIDGPGAEGQIRFHFYDTEGKDWHASATFPHSQTSASTATCDVSMGSNRLRGEFPRWEMHFRDGGFGYDLIFRNLTQGVRMPPDGSGGNWAEEPRRYMGWVIAQPRAEMTGELIVEGRRIYVHGIGYHDHNWGAGGQSQSGMNNLGSLWDHWYWGRLHLPNHTLVYSVGTGAPSLGGSPARLFVALKGEKLLTFSTRIDYQAKDMMTDDLTGCEYPQELVLKLQHRKILGDVSLKLRRVLQRSQFETRGHAYLSFLADCHADLDVDGEKVNVTFPAIHEHMKPER